MSIKLSHCTDTAVLSVTFDVLGCRCWIGSLHLQMVDVVDLTEDSDEEEPQRRTLPQRAGKPRPGELSIAALESR